MLRENSALARHTALDIALGMQHLHHQCPPIVHADLRSPISFFGEKNKMYLANRSSFSPFFLNYVLTFPFPLLNQIPVWLRQPPSFWKMLEGALSSIKPPRRTVLSYAEKLGLSVKSSKSSLPRLRNAFEEFVAVYSFFFYISCFTHIYRS